MSWAIYYDSNRVFTSDDGLWSDAPPEGVLAIVEKVGDRMTIHSGGDFYRLCDDGTVIATDDAATLLRSIGRVELGPLLFGRYTSNTNMARVFERIRREWS